MTEIKYRFLLSRRRRKSERCEPLATILATAKPDSSGVLNFDDPAELAAETLGASVVDEEWNVVREGVKSKKISFSLKKLKNDDGYIKRQVQKGESFQGIAFERAGLCPTFTIKFDHFGAEIKGEYWLTEIGEISQNLTLPSLFSSPSALRQLADGARELEKRS